MKVTVERIESIISTEWYITGNEIVQSTTPILGTGGITGHMFNDANVALGCLTICVLVLTSGFTVLGKSACADPSEFKPETGRKLAREDAVRQIWALEGYVLKQSLVKTPHLGD